MIVLTAGIKGGSGKSTLTTNLSVWLAGQGKDVMLLDTDSQATSTAWVRRRNENHPDEPVIHSAQALVDAVRPALALASRFEFVLVDASGRESKELELAMSAADVLLIPTRASAPDLETLVRMADLVGAARVKNPKLKVYAVVSMAPSNPFIKETGEALSFLSTFSELEVVPAVVRDRKVFRDAILAGLGVMEMSNGQAKAEIDALGTYIFREHV